MEKGYFVNGHTFVKQEQEKSPSIGLDVDPFASPEEELRSPLGSDPFQDPFQEDDPFDTGGKCHSNALIGSSLA